LSKALRLAALCPQDLPASSRIYFEHIRAELVKNGHEIIPFFDEELPEPVDLYWEPSTGRNGPQPLWRGAQRPVVVTFHGAANLALPISQCFGPGFKNRLAGIKSRLTTFMSWRFRKRNLSAVIAVSDYAKKEAEKYLGLPARLITPIYHGVDHSVFYPGAPTTKAGSYLLHVSSFQPKKNIERLMAAYLGIKIESKPRLVMVVPGYERPAHQAGIEIIRKLLEPRELAGLYRKALGFIFPSWHETFGLPILEAMACGCPVITSNNTGCSEIAGGAALLVNPGSVVELTQALKQLLIDPGSRQNLRTLGLRRARQFTWQKSAEEHLRLFEKIRKKE